jgi:hypothetical protein
MNSAEPKDGSYQEPQISHVVVRIWRTNEAFVVDDEARALCVNEWWQGSDSSERAISSTMAPKAKALTATPTCELRGIIRGAIYELWRSSLADTDFREEDFLGRVEDANLKLVSPRSTKIVAILLSSFRSTLLNARMVRRTLSLAGRRILRLVTGQASTRLLHWLPRNGAG